MFNESIWRAAIKNLVHEYYLKELKTLSMSLNMSESYLNEIADNPNYPNRVTSDYLNKKFVEFISSWITVGNPSGKKIFTIYSIPRYTTMSVPGQPDTVLDSRQGQSTNENRMFLLLLPSPNENKYIVLNFYFNYSDGKITSAEVGKYYESGKSWDDVIWTPLTQEEIDSLYYFDEKTGDKVWIRQLM
jgi:hypothetical protein